MRGWRWRAPASTVAPPSGGGSVPTAVSQTPTPVSPTPTPVSPTPTVAQAGGSGISELEAYCEEAEALNEELRAVFIEDFAASELGTSWGKMSQVAAKSADALEQVSPPDILKAYPSATIAFVTAISDFSRSQDASEPWNREVLFEASEVDAKLEALYAAVETLKETLDSETVAQLDLCFN